MNPDQSVPDLNGNTLTAATAKVPAAKQPNNTVSAESYDHDSRSIGHDLNQKTGNAEAFPPRSEKTLDPLLVPGVQPSPTQEYNPIDKCAHTD